MNRNEKLKILRTVLRTPRFRRLTRYALGALVCGFTIFMTIDLFFGVAMVVGIVQGVLSGAFIAEWISYRAFAKEAKADLEEAHNWSAVFEKAAAREDVYRMQLANRRRWELIGRIDRWIALAEDHDNTDAPWSRRDD